LHTAASLLPLLLLAAAACSPSSTDRPVDAAPAVDASAADALHPDTGGPDAAPSRAHNGPLFMRRARAGELAAFSRDEVDVDDSGELVLPAAGGHPGTDPYPAGTYHGGSYYTGGSYRHGTARSKDWVSAQPFDSVVPSFEAATPKGTWIAIGLSARVGGIWSKDYALGVWASTTETVKRHSVDGQDDSIAAVNVDTLALKSKADALRFTVQLFSENSATPRVRGVAAIVTDTTAPPPGDSSTPAALGKVLDVPQRSQLIYPGGAVWCSPTSTSMLLAYWAKELGKPELNETVPAAADAIYDWVYGGAGNWPFNTAHAASVGGGALHAIVTRLASFYQMERLIAAGIPAVISIETPTSSIGHLIVVRGFTASGDVVCNDPYVPTDAEAKVTYDRAELQRAWSHSHGATYVAWPKDTELPVDPLGAF
jgi:hypothetical protein